MIREDFVIINENGIYCRYGDFYLDPTLPVAKAVISHAHADHAIKGNGTIYGTEATFAFMHIRYGKGSAKVFNTVSYNTPFFIGDVKITLIPAGHMLGSAQVLMEFDGVRYLYAGDYKIQPDATCEPLEWVKPDVLIT